MCRAGLNKSYIFAGHLPVYWMLHRFVAILLIVALSISNISRGIIFTSFTLNQNYIASHLCANKSRPQLHCNGKCYLTKKLKQADDNENNQSQNSQKKQISDALVTERLTITPSVSPYQRNNPAGIALLPIKYSFSIFQPPQV